MDGEPVLAAELRTELERVRVESAGEKAPDASELPQLRRVVLDALIERRLLLAEARRRAVTVTEQEVDEALSRRQAPEGVAAPPPEEQAAVRARTRDQLLVDRLLLREVVERTAVGPDEARKYYDEHPDEFRSGPQVRVQQILVPRREDAEALRRELNRGTDFGKLAREHSTSPDAQAGGDIGWFEREALPPGFEEACFALTKKGQTSDVVQTDYGFHLFRLLDRREGRVQPFEQVEPVITQKLLRDAVARAQKVFVQRVRDNARVELFEAEISAVQ